MSVFLVAVKNVDSSFISTDDKTIEVPLGVNNAGYTKLDFETIFFA